MIDLSTCRHQRVHQLFKDALQTDPRGFVEGRVIEVRDWSTGLQAHYRIRLQLAGDCWLQLGGQRWPLVLEGQDRHAYPNGRYVPGRAVFHPKALRFKAGVKTYLIGASGRRHIELLRAPDGQFGVRSDFGKTARYASQRINARTRRRHRREALVRLILSPNVATKEWLRAHPTWWPESDRLRPKGMAKSDWKRLVDELRWGRRPQPRRQRSALATIISRAVLVKWLFGLVV